MITTLSTLEATRTSFNDDAALALSRLCAFDFINVVSAAIEARPDLTEEQLNDLSNKAGRIPHKRRWE